MASISATSVPGSGWTNQSAASAVMVPDRVDHDHVRPGGPGLVDEGPQVPVGQLGVGPRSGPGGRSGRRWGRRRGVPLVAATPPPRGRATERTGQPRRAETGEEAAVERHLQQTLGAGVPPGQDGLAAVGSTISCSPGGHEGERVVPRCALEVAVTLWRPRGRGGEDPLGAVHAVEEPVDLGAQLAPRVGVVRVAPQLRWPPSSTVTRRTCRGSRGGRYRGRSRALTGRIYLSRLSASRVRGRCEGRQQPLAA